MIKKLTVPNLQASNVFYYYADLEGAWAFYRDILGFETVVDYGFAKILRLAQTSYLTLVDAESGMHSIEEPKSVTLALVTDQVESWYDYLTTSGVRMHKGFELRETQPHDGFVALDPEGYFLEFERFNPHPENDVLMPLLSILKPTYSEVGSRPKELGVQATVLWLYYHDLGLMQHFYEGLFGVRLLVDQGWAKVYQAAGSGFIGLVGGKNGLHQATEQKGVTVSFFTDDIDSWFERAKTWPGFKLRTAELTVEYGRVRLFVGYDPEGYFLEWDTFLKVEENDVLHRQMKAAKESAGS
jgi:predicted enzyme related to lactoylglutathione lyase